jgi:hypothetical protein
MLPFLMVHPLHPPPPLVKIGHVGLLILILILILPLLLLLLLSLLLLFSFFLSRNRVGEIVYKTPPRSPTGGGTSFKPAGGALVTSRFAGRALRKVSVLEVKGRL